MSFQGRKLEKGEFICSGNKVFQFGITTDGTLSFCRNNSRIWSPDPSMEKEANHAMLQKSGNLVLYNSKSIAMWSTKTGGNQIAKVSISDSGSLSLVGTNEQILWIQYGSSLENTGVQYIVSNNSPPSQVTLQQPTQIVQSPPQLNSQPQPQPPNRPSRPSVILIPIVQQPSPSDNSEECDFSTPSDSSCIDKISTSMSGQQRTFRKGDFICSPDKNFQFGLTNSGVLSLCKQGEKAWFEESSENKGSFASLQRSGNFVLYDSATKAIWQTKTNGNPNAQMSVSNDGKVSLSNNNNEVWNVIAIETPMVLPTGKPTTHKTVKPTFKPTKVVSLLPTQTLSLSPSLTLSNSPSNWPSNKPTFSPSYSPSNKPSYFPSYELSHLPSILPSYFPSNELSHLPSTWPTKYPSYSPSIFPSNKPSHELSHLPSILPSYFPSNELSHLPSTWPTKYPSYSPSIFPSNKPSFSPTQKPTLFPSGAPTPKPTIYPTEFPTTHPTIRPSPNPTKNPTLTPTSLPSSHPSTSPTLNPTLNPTNLPTSKPTSNPTLEPTMLPTLSPTANPTFTPTDAPTSGPTPMDPLIKCEFDPDLMKDPTCRDTLTPDLPNSERRMYVGQFMCSPNKDFLFGMTLDGYLAICEGNKKVWKAGPWESQRLHAHFKTNGNLAVYTTEDRKDNSWDVLFRSKTNEYENSVLTLQDDGVVKITSIDNNVVWKAEPEEGPKSSFPTISPPPTVSPTLSFKPTVSHAPIGSYTYRPGELKYDADLGIYLSVGLKGRLIAETGNRVNYWWGGRSLTTFHDQPDAGGCFEAEDGGWYYMSNAEIGDGGDPDGGVGRIKFNSKGDVLEYKMVLQGTRMNCGSGYTPWSTYISCEEFRGGENRPAGQCWEVHPEDKWQPRPTKMGGSDGGKFESAAFDSRNMRKLKGFVTTDSKDGPVLRFTPNPVALESALDSNDFSELLHTDGFVEYLVVNNKTQTFEWSTDKSAGELSAMWNYPNTEGIDAHEGRLYFVSKKQRELFILDLDNMSYTKSSTLSGAFNGQPDQIVRLISDNPWSDDLLYFLEDGGNNPAGVFSRDASGKYFTIATGGESNSDESTGLAFCDNGRRMMFAFQDEGKLFEIMREDGLPFHGTSLDIKYHNV